MKGRVMPKTSAEDKLFDAIAALAGGHLSPGQEVKGTLTTEELEIEIVAKVRRRVRVDAAAEYRTRALAHLAANPHLVWHCQCSVSRRSPWSRGGKSEDDCKGKIAAVVVYKTWTFDHAAPAGERSRDVEAFRFVCNRHRENHSIDPQKVLATVELPPSRYATILAEAQKERDRRDAERRLEDETRDAVRALLERDRANSKPVKLVDVDRLVFEPDHRPRPGDEVDVDAATVGDGKEEWIRARVIEIRSTGFVSQDAHGRTWACDFSVPRWRSTGHLGKPEVAAAMELLKLGEPVDVYARVKDDLSSWYRATVDAFREGGFYWKYVDDGGRPHFGAAATSDGGTTWRLTRSLYR
jgi:hypothetical protein